MRFRPTELEGAFLIEIEKREDTHGFFARTFCEEEFARAGLVTRYVQANASGNPRAGTLRGLHYQVAPTRRSRWSGARRGRSGT
jgi:dTDP-4-dehydrorhamnose 3,5-epimerase